MYVLLSDDKHWFVRDNSLCALVIQDNVQDKFFQTIFFLKNFFPTKSFCQIFSRTEFCLRLDFVPDWILSRILSRITYRSCMHSFNLFVYIFISFLPSNTRFSMYLWKQQAMPFGNCYKLYSRTCFERPLNFLTKIGRKRQLALQKRGKNINIKSMELHKRLTS